jgi:hypothetical protein
MCVRVHIGAHRRRLHKYGTSLFSAGTVTVHADISHAMCLEERQPGPLENRRAFHCATVASVSLPIDYASAAKIWRRAK